MDFKTVWIPFKTESPIEWIDLTQTIAEEIRDSQIQNGFCCVASPHTTVSVVLNERCEALQQDMLDLLARFVPQHAEYRHNKIAGDGRPNAHSHLLSLFLPSQQLLSIESGKLQLGTWQSIFALELDGPRSSRRIQLKMHGL